MTSSPALAPLAAITVNACDVLPGDRVRYTTLNGIDRVHSVARSTRHEVTIDYRDERGRVIYDVVRLHMAAGDSYDYAPDVSVRILRADQG